MSFPEKSDQPRVYALRFTQRALTDIDVAYARFEELADVFVADSWKDGLFETVIQLAVMPHRQIVPESARFQQEVRQLLYRRQGSAVAYRILFTVQEDSLDGPTVLILTLRHGARKPITRAEVQEIEHSE